MPHLQEIFNTKEDTSLWAKTMENWGKIFWNDIKKIEPRLLKFPRGKSTFTYKNYFDNGARLFIIHNDDDEACGYTIMGVSASDHFGENPKDDTLQIYELFLDIPHRGKGLGTYVLDYWEEYARKDKDIKMIQLGHFVKNTRAAKLYEKHGFSEWSTSRIKFL